jgi:hypothetical protein
MDKKNYASRKNGVKAISYNGERWEISKFGNIYFGENGAGEFSMDTILIVNAGMFLCFVIKRLL